MENITTTISKLYQRVETLLNERDAYKLKLDKIKLTIESDINNSRKMIHIKGILEEKK